MQKFWFVLLMAVITILHLWAFQNFVNPLSHVVKKQTKITKITLSQIAIKKPLVPPVEIPKIQTKPIQKPHIKSKPKKHPKKRPKKKIKKISPQTTPVTKVIKEPISANHEVAKPMPKPVAKVDTTSIKDHYTSAIRKQIKEKLFYPKVAKRMRMQGIVLMKFTVTKKGEIEGIKVDPGAKKILKRGALKTINTLKLPPLPKELGTNLIVRIPIEFRLKD